MTELQDRLDREIFKERRIAFVGVAKNSGKTTTLNWCLARAFALKKHVLALSIGLDGERLDALLGTPKPPVFLYEGQWCITTQKMLECSSATLKIQTALGIHTPLGETVIAKVVKAGEIVLTGLRHRQDLAEVQKECPVEHIFMDGAYGRLMAAHGRVCDGIILSTGAVAGETLEEILIKTKEIVKDFSISRATGWRASLFQEAMTQERSLIGGPNIALPLSHPSALLGLSDSEKLWTTQTRGIAIVGMLSDSIAKNLLKLPDRKDPSFIILRDPTSLHLSKHVKRRLLKKWTIETFEGNAIIAISVNPTSVKGHRFACGEIEKKLLHQWPKLAIFDPLSLVVE